MINYNTVSPTGGTGNAVAGAEGCLKNVFSIGENMRLGGVMGFVV